MGKKLLLLIFLSISLFANEAEKFFWDEVKNTNDIEFLKLYKKKYPNGLFEEIANIKIKRLKKSNKPKKDENGIPLWLKGENINYKYYGIGKSSTHFKGQKYQKNLAKKRAYRELEYMFEDSNLTKKQILELKKELQTEIYTDKKGRVYIFLYIDEEL